MKRIFILLLLASAAMAADRWVYAGTQETDNGPVYVDSETLKYQVDQNRSMHAFVWIKFVDGTGGGYAMVHEEIDEATHQERMLSGAKYASTGAQLQTYGLGVWKEIIPNSIGEGIYRILLAEPAATSRSRS